MKRLKLNIRKALLLAICLFLLQLSSIFAKNIENGFWTIEANDKTEKYTIVRFYDDKQNLLYEEKIEGVTLMLTSKNKRVLDQTLSRLINKSLVGSQIKAGKLASEIK